MSQTNIGSNLETSNIIEVQFGIFDPKKILRGSVCEVLTPDTYDNNVPKVGGLMDSRMGVIDRSIRCHTCELDNRDCIGHFGHVKLALPVFHIQYMNYILKLLRCICFRCSNVLIDKTDIKIMNKINKLSKKKRFDYIFSLCNNTNQSNKIKRCMHNDGCMFIQPLKYVKLTKDKIKEKDGIIKICAEFPSETFSDPTISKKQYYPPETCLNIFRKIIPEDVELLGFSVEDSHPSWMICTILAIPPPSVRPSISQDQIQRSEDDLTHKLIDIVKTNRMLQQKIDANVQQKTIEDYRTLVQYHVATLIDSEILGKDMLATRRSLRQLKVLKQRLSSKEGRLRHNLMGKRVDYCGRTVISVDPNISIDEIGMPISICMNITFPEIVSIYNIDEMYRLVKNGPNVYPGANLVEKAVRDESGSIVSYRPYKLFYMNNKVPFELEYGDLVRRHLRDNDIVLFNRQPSLHKMSMMAHKIKVLMVGLTFRLNVYVTTPYNADFDGDEMNCHVPQSVQTSYELQSIASVPTQIISPTGKPIISIVQDTMIASYLFTQSDYRVCEYDMMNLLSVLSDYEGEVIKSSDGYYSGRNIYSKILPNVNLIKPNSSYDDEKSDVPSYNDTMVIIKNGELLQGVLDTKLLGPTNGGIVHNVYNMHGMNVCMDYLNNHQRLITRWFTSHSFTIGIGDTIISQTIVDDKNKIIDESLESINDLLHQVEEGTYNPNLNKGQIMKCLEYDIMSKLSEARDNAGKLVNKSLSKHNRIYQIVNSGSKGSIINIAQIIACVGQQDMDGKRVPFNFSNRTLPHYHYNDLSPESRGFVRNSFVEGLTPQEYFFHMMSGRDGVIDTAIKTADSGYTQRRLIKAMEDVKVEYDWTVKNANKHIVQFRYGDDSMDTAKLEIEKFKIIEMDNKKIENVYKYDNYEDKSYWNYILVNKVVNELFATKDYIKILDEEYNLLYNARNELRYNYYKNITVINISVLSPINFYRLVQDIMYKFNIQDHDKSDLNPLYIIKKTNETLQELGKYNNINMLFIRILFRSHLASKRCITEYKLSKTAFDHMLEIIKDKFFKSFVTPGELVGPVAAQTIGEVSTQLTLNSLEWNESIIINRDGSLFAIPIGQFIDNIINNTDVRNIQYHPNDTKYVPLHIKDNYKIQSIDEDGNIMWKTIEAVTRHPPINKDGSNTLVKITTNSGRTVIATKSKSFLTKVGNKILPIRGDELKINDAVPIMLDTPFNDLDEIRTCILYSRTIPLTDEFAILIAKLINHGIICYKNGYIDSCQIHNVSLKVYKALCKFCDTNGFTANYNFTTSVFTIFSVDVAKWCKYELNIINESYTNGVYDTPLSRLPEWLIFAPIDFLRIFLQTYFDEVCYIDLVNNYVSCMCTSVVMCDTMINILGRFSIIVERNIVDVYIGLKYLSDSNIGRYEIILRNSSITLFNIVIGITNRYKTLKMNNIKLDDCDDYNCECNTGGILNNAYFDKIIKIENYESKHKYVYDFTVSDTKNFIIHSGLAVRDTFHKAGTGLSAPSVGRLKEIISVTANIHEPFTNIYMKEEYSTNVEYSKNMISQLEYTRLEHIISRTQILYELPDPNGKSTIIDEDIEFINTYHKFNDILGVDKCASTDIISPWILRFEFDKEAVINKNIYMSDIQDIILSNCINDNNEKIQCIFNDDNASGLVMRIKILYESDDNEFILFLKDLEKKILNITLKGIPDITKVNINKQNKIQYNADGSYECVKENYLQTSGVNLLKIVNNDYNEYIDYTRIISNDICEMHEIFGIEAVRNLIVSEMAHVLSLSNSSKHIGILADVMTYQGYILKINRHGINKSDDNGPFHKCSFEETPDILSTAAIFSEKDHLNGVSGNIIMGQFVKAGSNNFDVLFDEQHIMDNNITATIDNQNQQYNVEDLNQSIDDIYKNIVSTTDTPQQDIDFDNNYTLDINKQYTLGKINMDGIKLVILK
jgi:DNA-directed RNA polymerase beta' subunit